MELLLELVQCVGLAVLGYRLSALSLAHTTAHAKGLQSVETRLIRLSDFVAALRDGVQTLRVEAVQRITELEAKPAEVITVEVPIVPPEVIARGQQSAGPSPKDEVTLILCGADHQQEVGRIVIDRRKRHPTVRYLGQLYQAVSEEADGWRYRRVEGR